MSDPLLSLPEDADLILRERYLQRSASGEYETPAEMFARVAHTVAQGEPPKDGARDAMAERFYELMVQGEFLPNSPALMNAGTSVGQLSACFVLPVEDSLECIFDAVKQMALIHQSGGGTGFSFSRLRPRGYRVRSTGGVASGPVSFIEVFDATTNVIKQGGRRRGANMAVLDASHPDILEFVRAKRDERLSNFNISVAMPDAFMDAEAMDGDWTLREPVRGAAVGRVGAPDLFKEIVAAAWETGDPGLLFVDEINRCNPTPALGRIEATNPCGEQPLLPYESCTLGSINVNRFLRATEIDWARLGEAVDTAVGFLDDVLEVNRFPLPEIETATLRTRKIGLGIMGWADLLIALGLPYASPQALALAERLMAFVTAQAHAASARLAQTRGPFPAFAGSVWDRRGLPMRNATVTTIAPTGTISLIAGASSGIEPLFALSFTRRALDGHELHQTNQPLVDALTRLGRSDLVEEVKRRGTLAGIDAIPDDLRALFATALDLSPADHLRVQMAFQRHTDSAVSKTINLPRSATPEQIADAYRMAYRGRLKGITVFRYGCKGEQVLSVENLDARTEAGIRVGHDFTGECRLCTQ